MKKHTLLFLLVLLFLMLTLLNGANAQKRYMVKIRTVGGSIIRGELLYASRDSLSLINRQSGGLRMNVSEISSIWIHRKGSVGQYVAVGAGVGVALGALVGLASYSAPDCPPGSFWCVDFGPGPSAAEGALIGMVAGAMVGSMVGSRSKEIKINADHEQLHAFIMEYGVGVPTSVIRRH